MTPAGRGLSLGAHFYFDIWDGESLAVGDWIERSMGRRVGSGAVASPTSRESSKHLKHQQLAIEVRNASGPILRVTFGCERVDPLSSNRVTGPRKRGSVH